MRLFWFLPLFAGTIFGQTTHFLSAGALGGAPLLDAFHSTSSGSLSDCVAVCIVSGWGPATKHFTFGPAVELRLPYGLAVEVDVLYSRLNFSESLAFVSPSSGANFQFFSTAASRWEFPFLLKHRFHGEHACPFLVAGPAFDFVGGIREEVDLAGKSLVGHLSFAHATSHDSADRAHSSTAGVMVGGGWEWSLGPLRIAPQFRYSAWPAANFQSGDQFRSNPNEANFLIGLMF